MVEWVLRTSFTRQGWRGRWLEDEGDKGDEMLGSCFTTEWFDCVFLSSCLSSEGRFWIGDGVLDLGFYSGGGHRMHIMGVTPTG